MRCDARTAERPYGAQPSLHRQRRLTGSSGRAILQPMGILSFFEWVERKLDKPADQSLLLRDGRNQGSEAMIKAKTPEASGAAGATVRRKRARRTWRWGSLR
jgi:hypothetical protein